MGQRTSILGLAFRGKLANLHMRSTVGTEIQRSSWKCPSSKNLLEEVAVGEPSFEEATMDFLASSRATKNMCRWKKY